MVAVNFVQLGFFIVASFCFLFSALGVSSKVDLTVLGFFFISLTLWLK